MHFACITAGETPGNGDAAVDHARPRRLLMQASCITRRLPTLSPEVCIARRAAQTTRNDDAGACATPASNGRIEPTQPERLDIIES